MSNLVIPYGTFSSDTIFISVAGSMWIVAPDWVAVVPT